MSDSHDITNFEAEVIDRSHQQPVLVDFWAPWCGPCRMLGPVLEKLAAADHRWTLAKVNIDEHPELADAHAIRSIPAVKLFHRGRAIAEFVGALPEAQLRRWLDQHLPSAGGDALAKAKELLLAGRFVEAEQVLAPLHAAAPARPEVRLALARARVFRDPAAALDLIEGQAGDEAELVRSFARVLAIGPADLPEYSAKTPLLGGLAELRAGRFPEALRLLIASMEESVRYADGAARQACLAIFRHLGPHHPVTLEFHRRFSMASF